MSYLVKTYLSSALLQLYNAANETDALPVRDDIESAIQAVERVRTKVILRERNQGKPNE